nr:MAG TPA: hypothetical protein [Caudoviricetes sp.]
MFHYFSSRCLELLLLAHYKLAEVALCGSLLCFMTEGTFTLSI